MRAQAQAAREKALILPVADPSQQADLLLRSQDDVPLTEAEQAELDALWEPEIRRRIDEIESGRVKMYPWDEVKAELRKLIGA